MLHLNIEKKPRKKSHHKGKPANTPASVLAVRDDFVFSGEMATPIPQKFHTNQSS